MVPELHPRESLIFRVFRCLLCWALLTCGSAQAAESHLALASSLRLAAPALLDGFAMAHPELTHGPDSPGVTFGSSGNLSRQISLGAPFDLFISANETFANVLVEKHLTKSGGQVVATGQLAWVAKSNSPLAETLGKLGDGAPLEISRAHHLLLETIRRDGIASLAIANPKHAPYGVAALESLQHAGLAVTDDSPVQRILRGENASQALQFVLSGGAELGLVPTSLVVESLLVSLDGPASSTEAEYESDNASQFVAILADPATYRQVKHRMVLMNNASELSAKLYAYLQSENARTIWTRYGFNVPGL